MHFKRLLLAIALILPALPLTAAKGEPYPGLSRKWQRYESPNFELYSANGDRDSRDVLEKMELLRALFLDTFQLKPRLPQPVTIFYFDRQDDFDGYRPLSVRGGTARYLGFCSSSSDRTIITLAPTRNRGEAREVVYHEYVHYLFRITEQSPPPWFNEGMAELFSTMEEDKEWLNLGMPVVDRVLDLQRSQMMPFDQLFAVRYESPLFRDSGHTGIFYAQSWAFLHYCRFGVNKIPPEKMAMFLRIAGAPRVQERPAEFRAACKELLGMDYPELQRALERYVESGRFQGRKAKRPAIADRQTYQVRPVEREEMNVRLAEVALRITGSAHANLFVRGRLEQAPDVRLHELLGSVALDANETEVARQHWRQAVELGTTNAAIFRELARLEANAVFERFDLDYRMPPKRAENLRLLLKKSIECAPEQSMGYEMLAWVEASVQAPDIANVNLVQGRFATLNDRARTVLALALVRSRLNQKEQALELLKQVEKLQPSDWVRYCAELTSARLENRPIDSARLPKSTGPGMPIAIPVINLPH